MGANTRYLLLTGMTDKWVYRYHSLTKSQDHVRVQEKTRFLRLGDAIQEIDQGGVWNQTKGITTVHNVRCCDN